MVSRASGTLPSPCEPLSVGVVTYAPDLERLGACLDRLAHAVAELAPERATVFIVDNGPAADSAVLAGWLARHFPGTPDLVVRRLSGHGNVGFGRGHNQALQATDAAWHLILNPDAELAPDALVHGLRWLRADPEVALVAAWTTGPDGRFQPLCKTYPTARVLALRGLGLPGGAGLRAAYDLPPAPGPVTDVTGGLVSGSFMLCRTAALRAVGGFDPAYFLYFEDFDLSLRLARGGRLLWPRDVRVVHHGGGAARKGWRHRWHFARSAVTFFRRHGWRW